MNLAADVGLGAFVSVHVGRHGDPGPSHERLPLSRNDVMAAASALAAAEIRAPAGSPPDRRTLKLMDCVLRRWVPVAVIAVTGCVVPRSAAEAQAAPDARAHHQLVYHAGDARTYLIGGSTRREGGYHYFDDVWYWEGAAWTQAAPLPFPRSSHRVVYHAQRNSLILFGGGFADALRAEGIIWESGPAGWKAVAGNFRAAASEPGLCYDHRRERVVIFGGWDADAAYSGDTWEWAGADLVQVDSAGPTPRAGHAFLYDPVRERCLLFGGRGADGYLADTWEWDGEGWHRLEATGPSPRWFFGAAADLESRRIVIFGGRGPPAPVGGRDASRDLGDTWIWDGERWELLDTEGPPARSGAQLASTGHSVLLFGGREDQPGGFRDRNDLWELRGRSWVRRR